MTPVILEARGRKLESGYWKLDTGNGVSVPCIQYPASSIQYLALDLE
jgi:hypothetical protein